METQKKLGIWMDHANANLIDLDSIYRSQSLRDIKKNNERIQEKLNMQLRNLNFYEQQIQNTLKK